MRSLVAAIAAALLLAPAASAHTDSPKQIAFAWRAQGIVTTTFGPQLDGRFHAGLDIGVLTSLAVTAASAGTVVAVGAPPGFEGYGNVVLVDLGGAIEAARNRGVTLLESFPPEAFPDEEQAGLIEECELHIHMLEIAEEALPGRVRELEEGIGRILDPDDVSGWRAQPG